MANTSNKQIVVKPKAEWNEYEIRLHRMLTLMKVGVMLKKAKIEHPKTDNQ